MSLSDVRQGAGGHLSPAVTCGSGGGGSGYAGPAVFGPVLIGGNGAAPANTGDSAYRAGVGVGAVSLTASTNGGDGLVVVTWS